MLFHLSGISPFDLNLDGNFDEQVRKILDNVRLSREEVNNLQLLHNDLSAALEAKWPGCKIFLFGSIATGLGMVTSDVDCFINVHPYILSAGGARLVMLARNILRLQPHIFKEPFAIPKARVPIVKFNHLPTGRNCDINFTSPSGVSNSELIAFFLNCDYLYLTLAVLIKYWSKVHGLTGTNLISSYSLTLLVIYYLQHIKLLPSVKQLQKHCTANIVANWNNGFNSSYSEANVCDRSLYHLIGGFFKFYSTFDFKKYIISLYMGTVIPRELFSSLAKVPIEFDTYKFNVHYRICRPIQTQTTFCLQDPFDHSSNVMRGVFPNLANTFLDNIQLAATMYDETNTDNFIKAILTKKPTIKIVNELNVNSKQIGAHYIQKAQQGRIKKRANKHKKKKNSLSVLYQQITSHIKKFH
ncbi:hypothetical protein ACJJTC_016390 [Scirpophaga incertulas]